MDEAANFCCTYQCVHKQGSPDPDPMHACSGSARKGPLDCEEKRDPRERSPAIKPEELDLHARLEKQKFAPSRTADSYEGPFVGAERSTGFAPQRTFGGDATATLRMRAVNASTRLDASC